MLHRLLVSLGQYMGLKSDNGQLIREFGITDEGGKGNLKELWAPGKDPEIS